MKTKRKVTGGGNGTPFTDEQLASILRHEKIHDKFNGKVPPGEFDDLEFWYTGSTGPIDWNWFRDATLKVAASKKRHSLHGPTWSEFPHNLADVEAVIRWRAANPRG